MKNFNEDFKYKINGRWEKREQKLLRKKFHLILNVNRGKQDSDKGSQKEALEAFQEASNRVFPFLE